MSIKPKNHLKEVKADKIVYNPYPISRQDAESALRGTDSDALRDALVRLVSYDPDPEYVLERCVEAFNHSNDDVKTTVMACFAQLFMANRWLNAKIMISMMKKYLKHPNMGRFAKMNIEDIQMSLREKKKD